MESPETSESENGVAEKYSSVKRIRNELVIEAVLVVAGFLLAFGLTTKIVLAIVVACFRFAIPDCFTAWLVLRCDPDRWHGIAIALLFTALGFVRASIFAFAVLFITICILISVGGPKGQPAAAGFGAGFLCAYGFLAAVFPLAFVAASISWTTGKPLDFAAGLTKLRRNKHTDQKEISVEVWDGLKLVGIASGISLTVILIAPLTIIPNMGFFFAAFIAPFVWIPIFWTITTPKN